jgi:hypothetical protein
MMATETLRTKVEDSVGRWSKVMEERARAASVEVSTKGRRLWDGVATAAASTERVVRTQAEALTASLGRLETYARQRAEATTPESATQSKGAERQGSSDQAA